MRRTLEVRCFASGWQGAVWYVCDVVQAKRERSSGRVSPTFLTQEEALAALTVIAANRDQQAATE